MQIVTLLLLVAALGCLIVGLMMSNTVWIVASLVASVIAVFGTRAARRRAEEASARRTRSDTELARPASAREQIAALAAEVAAERTAALFAPAVEPETAAPSPAGRQARSTQRAGRAVAVADAARRPDVAATVPADLVASQPTTDEVAVGDDDPVDEPAPANTLAPLSDKSHENVWVIDGRPRYHLSSCGFLVGHDAGPIPLQQAVEDGFSPCSRCDPDTALASA